MSTWRVNRGCCADKMLELTCTLIVKLVLREKGKRGRIRDREVAMASG